MGHRKGLPNGIRSQARPGCPAIPLARWYQQRRPGDRHPALRQSGLRSVSQPVPAQRNDQVSHRALRGRRSWIRRTLPAVDLRWRLDLRRFRRRRSLRAVPESKAEACRRRFQSEEILVEFHWLDAAGSRERSTCTTWTNLDRRQKIRGTGIRGRRILRQERIGKHRKVKPRSTESPRRGVGPRESDDFSFDLRSIAHIARTSEPTKRNVLRIAAKFYDPTGYLTPVIVQFKMLFQELCKGRLDWSAELTGELKAKWQKLVAELQQIDRITLPRYIFHRIASSVNTCSLHGFCDASNKAYAAVVYLQVTTTSGSCLRFLASKTRVGPVAQQTIPRLELLSALILARLVTNVRQALEEAIKVTGTTCWSDSEVALFWIWGESKTWKPFVQNRVEEIRSLVPVSSWKHCPGSTNPADLPSRGMTPMELSRSTLWEGWPMQFGPQCWYSRPGQRSPKRMPQGIEE